MCLLASIQVVPTEPPEPKLHCAVGQNSDKGTKVRRALDDIDRKLKKLTVGAAFSRQLTARLHRGNVTEEGRRQHQQCVLLPLDISVILPEHGTLDGRNELPMTV